MPYLIDGHNLIGAMPDISLRDAHDEMKLVNKLRSFAARKSKRVTVIFDRGMPGGRSPMSNHAVEVIFASDFQTSADDYIMRRIPRLIDPRGWTLVTSDQKIVGLAKGYRLSIVKSAAFAQMLNLLPEPPEKGEWIYPIITAREVDELARQMSEHTPAVSTDMPPATATAEPTTDTALDASSRTLPKPKPKPSPTTPRPKPPRPHGSVPDDEKPFMPNTMSEWMRLFGVDEE